MPSFQVSHLGIESLWATSRGRGVKVAVLDTGVTTSEGIPDARVTALESDGKRPQGSTGSSHGTFCVSLIASEFEEAEGIAPECKVVSYRVATGDDSFSEARVVQALAHALRSRCDVISCSFSLPKAGAALRGLVRDAHTRGVPLVAAAGNDPSKENEFPEEVMNAIAVGALDASNKPMEGRHGKWIDVYSLGDDLDVVNGDGAAEEWPGMSSGAAAVVSGIIALALAPLTPARRRRAGMAVDGLLKSTALRRPHPVTGDDTFRVVPSLFFQKIQEIT